MATTPEDFFRSLDRERIACWLWTGITAVYNDSSYEAFAPLQQYMRRGDSLLDDLGHLYRYFIPMECQLLFRQAIGDLIEGHTDDVSEPNTQMVANLICLLAVVQAVEALPQLIRAAGYGKAAAKEAGTNGTLLYDALSALRSFAPSPELRNAMLDLMKAPNFHDRFLPSAIQFLDRNKLLNEGNPEVPMLKERLDVLYRNTS